MKVKVTVSYDKYFIFNDVKTAMDFAVTAKQSIVPSKYDKSTKVTIELLNEDEGEEEEE